MPEGFPNHSPAEIRAHILQSTDTLRSFRANARVTVRSPDQNRSFNANVQQKRADSLFMRFSKFGVEGARLLVTPDSVFFFDSRQGTLQVGPVQEVQEILPVPVTSDQVFANMLGLLVPDPSVNWTVEADSSQYYLTDPSERRRLTIDPTNWRVVRYARESADGTLIEERLFSNFEPTQGHAIPRRIIFRRPDDKVMAMIDYRDIQLNPNTLSLSLDVPPDIPRKPLR